MPTAFATCRNQRPKMVTLPGVDQRGRELVETSPATNGVQEEMGGKKRCVFDSDERSRPVANIKTEKKNQKVF